MKIQPGVRPGLRSPKGSVRDRHETVPRGIQPSISSAPDLMHEQQQQQQQQEEETVQANQQQEHCQMDVQELQEKQASAEAA
ncbi:unnamed protein product, partial [Ectocarpus fasciculatus]